MLEWKTCPESNTRKELNRFLFFFSVRNKSENYFQFRSQSGSKKRSCLLFSAVQSSLLADWSSPNKCVFVCA